MKKLKILALFLPILFILLITSPLYATVVHEVKIAEGIQKMSDGSMKEALSLFEEALEASPGNLEATYYSGMALSRLGEFERAEGVFNGLLEKDAGFQNAHLELGRLYYVLTECDKAEQSLDRFTSLSDDEEQNQYADEMKLACRGEEAEDRGGSKKEHYINLSLGLQHDDNVIVEPSNPVNPSDRKSDMKGLLYLAAGKTLFNRGAVTLKGDYTLYMSQHTHMSDFNLQFHQLSPTVEFDVSNIIRPSAGYSFGYTAIGGDTYTLKHDFFGKVKVVMDEKFSTDISYLYGKIKYRDSDLFETASIRNGHKNSVGIKQKYSDKFDVDLYFYYDKESTKTDYWDYDGFRVGGSISSEIVPLLYGSFAVKYSEREFDELSPGETELRHDKVQQYSGSLTYVINSRFSLMLSESYTINSSNLSIFDYRRNVISLFVTAGVL